MSESDGNFILPHEHSRISGMLTREGVEHSVPLKFNEDVIGRIVIKTDGTLVLDLNMSRAGCTLRDILVEGDLNALGLYFIAAKPAIQRMDVDTYWNGLPAPAERGTAVVADRGDFPQYWARHEKIVGQRIDVVRVFLDGVNYGGGVEYLDNRDGSGWLKVTEGHGSPTYGHRNVTIEPDSFERGKEPNDP